MDIFRTSIRYISERIAIRRNPTGYARSKGVTVGERCRFLGLKPGSFGSEPYLITLGDHVTITSGVRFVTHDGGVWVFRDEFPDIDVFGPITIGSNVFIGINAIIMPGVSIGSNCIIGAGSIVTRDIPPGSVAAGVPARVLRDLESYRNKILPSAHHIRSRSVAEKRRLLSEWADRKNSELM